MARKRIRLNLDVDLDEFPGTFHTAKSATAAIQYILAERIGHYNPSVSLQLGVLDEANTGEFELVYLDARGGEHSVTNASRVEYSTLGISIQFGENRLMIPWYRVLSIFSTTQSIAELMAAAAFG